MFCVSENLYLRDVKLSDSSIVAKWKNDPLIRELSIGLDTKITNENQESDIKKSIESKQPYYIISLKDSDRPIGYIRLNWMDNSERFGWLRFGLGEERGKGYSKEALSSFLQKVFSNDTHRIDAEVYAFNKISLNLLKSLGFIHEGTRRNAYYTKGSFFDVYTLGLLKGEFNYIKRDDK
ncbi:GNAT family N-acetyltransferase [Fictibacillus sp. BK138]|uniref:GNAT family N-acetyltransferase n=1 Tax=Fictibacillus sp. BK138 TaxID=2512121 RepID=UPI0010D50D79|nr:GNAT family protein [Fictibacillus sp. BK138]RZT15518.1 RimJ/RimL family protein N-acetyltransferase [Fictibacillus sp. BK138]